jgi:hypothetical protein
MSRSTSARRFVPLSLMACLLIGLAAGGAAAASQSATYELVFEATWSASTHPVGFPPNPHFSGLIGATHNAQVAFWTPGVLASAGIEAMAETGSKSPLDSEVQTAIVGGTAGMLISGGGIPVSPGSVSVSLTVTQQHSRISVVSMIAPSPDWFVGVRDLDLFENGDWVSGKVVTLFPWDAGTDSGTDYTSPNQDTNPAEPIALITTGGVGNGQPLGTFTLVRTDVVPSTRPLGLFSAGLVLFGIAVAFLAARRRRA